MSYYDDYDTDDLEAEDEPVLAPWRPPLNLDRLVAEALARLETALSIDVVGHLHDMRGGRLPAGVLSVRQDIRQDFVETKHWGGYDFVTQRVPTTRETVAVVSTWLDSWWCQKLQDDHYRMTPIEITGLYLPGRWLVMSAGVASCTSDDRDVVGFRLQQVPS